MRGCLPGLGRSVRLPDVRKIRFFFLLKLSKPARSQRSMNLPPPGKTLCKDPEASPGLDGLEQLASVCFSSFLLCQFSIE